MTPSQLPNPIRHGLVLLLVGAVCAACSRCGRVEQAEPVAAPPRATASAVPPAARAPDKKVGRSRQAPRRKSAKSLLGRIKQLRATASYEAPTPEALRTYTERLTAAIAATRLGQKPSGPTADGFELEALSTPAGTLWLLVEAPEQRRGAGVVVLRSKALVPLVIEAPHTFFDTHTLVLAAEAFEQLKARALLVNTVHRAGEAQRGEQAKQERARLAHSGAAPADVAHLPTSFFQAAHQALQREGAPLALQLHGFADRRGRGVDAIVSAARTLASIEPLAGALAEALPGFAVRRYPSEVRRLGGTTNTQARWSRKAPERKPSTIDCATG